LTIGHILNDGAIEPHAATERRLLEIENAEGDLFATEQHERIAAAYRRRARAIAFRGIAHRNTGAIHTNKKRRINNKVR
jgi:hypothetical protein